ncbi:MAG: amidohydrolase [Acidobacteriaceae bacterium]|nr:amidohydrolase [Acidobacteriaceae bacterium]
MKKMLLAAVLASALAQAQPVDAIYSARYVVTMDAQRRVIENGALAVMGEFIVDVGPASEIAQRHAAKQRVDRPEAILMPGLINTHTHAPMSLFRGLADDLRLQDWLQKYIFPAEAKNVDAEFVTWGTRLACLEMMLSGTTAYVDMYFFEDRIAEATKEAGLRGVLGETIIGFKDPDAATPEDGLRYAERFIQRFHADPLIVPAVAPHALYTNSDQTLKAARQLADSYHVPLVIHLSETKKENEDEQAKHHMSPTQYLNSLGVLNGPTIAAHGVWLDDADMEILKARGTGIAHNPSSNMKLASGIAPVVKLLRKGIPVGLGTDGPAGSNNDLDMLEELNLAADLQKVANMDPQVLPAQQAVEMGTILGAKVAGLDKITGSLESGKHADFITLRLDRPHAVPLYNVYSQIVYALKGSDVRDVVVNGRTIVQDGRSLTLNQDQIVAKAREYGVRVSKSLHAPGK